MTSNLDSSWTILPVTRADFDALLPLVRAYCEFYDVAPSDSDLRTMFTALAGDPQNEGVQLIAWDEDGRPVGFATVYWSWSTAQAARIGVLNDLFVISDARGRGAAEALMRRASSSAGGAARIS